MRDLPWGQKAVASGDAGPAARQACTELHRFGITDQNRALVYAAATGAGGVLVGVAIGLSVHRQ